MGLAAKTSTIAISNLYINNCSVKIETLLACNYCNFIIQIIYAVVQTKEAGRFH